MTAFQRAPVLVPACRGMSVSHSVSVSVYVRLFVYACVCLVINATLAVFAATPLSLSPHASLSLLLSSCLWIAIRFCPSLSFSLPLFCPSLSLTICFFSVFVCVLSVLCLFMSDSVYIHTYKHLVTGLHVSMTKRQLYSMSGSDRKIHRLLLTMFGN